MLECATDAFDRCSLCLRNKWRDQPHPYSNGYRRDSPPRSSAKSARLRKAARSTSARAFSRFLVSLKKPTFEARLSHDIAASANDFDRLKRSAGSTCSSFAAVADARARAQAAL